MNSRRANAETERGARTLRRNAEPVMPTQTSIIALAAAAAAAALLWRRRRRRVPPPGPQQPHATGHEYCLSVYTDQRTKYGRTTWYKAQAY